MGKVGRPKKIKRSATETAVVAVGNSPIATKALTNEQLALQLDITDKFKGEAEKTLAQSLLTRYLADFVIESVSDINALKEIIYLEIVQFRLQDKLNDMYTDDTKMVNWDTLEVIHKNSDCILKLKATLGLKSDLEKLDDYSALENLKRRHKQWRAENQGSRYLKCPHCCKPILLKIKTEAWDAGKHPFFQDNFLCNQTLLENLDQTVLIDRDFIAKVFDTSPNYINWILNHMKNSPLLVNQDQQSPLSEEVQDGKVTDNGDQEEKGREEEVVSTTRKVMNEETQASDTPSAPTHVNGNSPDDVG